MKNRFQGTCSVCKAQVLPGQGFLSREDNRWIVTHADRCPRGDASCEESAIMQAKQALGILDDSGAPIEIVHGAIRTLGRIARTGWVDYEACRTRVLSSRATRAIHRCDLEELIIRFLTEPARKS